MTLAVNGKASLDDLEAAVRRCFSPFPFGSDEHYMSKDTFQDPWPKNYPCAWPLLVQSTPCKPRLRQLRLNWTIPPTLKAENGTANQLLSHLIGHEGRQRVLLCLRVESTFIYSSKYTY